MHVYCAWNSKIFHKCSMEGTWMLWLNTYYYISLVLGNLVFQRFVTRGGRWTMVPDLLAGQRQLLPIVSNSKFWTCTLWSICWQKASSSLSINTVFPYKCKVSSLKHCRSHLSFDQLYNCSVAQVLLLSLALSQLLFI